MGGESAHHWTPRLEEVARRAMAHAEGYAWMYERQVARAKKWGAALSILAGGLGALVGTRAAAQAALPEGSPPSGGRPAAVAEAAAGYAIALLTVLDRTWKLEVVRAQALVAQVDFAHVAQSIRFQLALSAEDRQDAREFVKHVLGEIETLKLSSPTLDSADRRALAAKFGEAAPPLAAPPLAAAPPATQPLGAPAAEALARYEARCAEKESELRG